MTLFFAQLSSMGNLTGSGRVTTFVGSRLVRFEFLPKGLHLLLRQALLQRLFPTTRRRPGTGPPAHAVLGDLIERHQTFVHPGRHAIAGSWGVD